MQELKSILVDNDVVFSKSRNIGGGHIADIHAVYDETPLFMKKITGQNKYEVGEGIIASGKIKHSRHKTLDLGESFYLVVRNLEIQNNTGNYD